MSLLLSLGGEYNLRSELFSADEQGIYLDPAITESARTWRRNLLTYSEGTIDRFTVKDQVSNAVTTISGFDNSIYFTDNSILRFCHAVLTTTVGVSHTFSIYVQMDDNSVPVPGSTTTTGDFSLIALSSLQSDVTVTLVSGSLYRLSKTFTGDGTSKNFGIVKYTGQSAKGFRVTGYQVEVGSLTTYQRITDFSTEFKAAFPTHTIYQDSNGVAPVTAPGDLVGLILDQRQGALSNLGLELTTNGGFDSDTWWTKSTNVTISGGVCQYSSVALNNGVFMSGIVTAGKFYKIEFTVSGFSSGGVRVYLGGTRTTAVSANGTYTYVMPAGSSDTQIIFEATSAGTILALDNVSVREVPGNHAYQSTSGARPTLGRVPFGGRRNLLTRSEEFDNAVWLKNNVNVTANTATSPSGSMADLCIPTVDNTTHFIRQISLPSNTYTFSCYLKAAGETQVSLWLASASVAGIFTLTGAGSFSGAGGLSAASIEHVGDGWYLCQVWHNVAGTTVHVYGRSGSAYIGNGTDGFYIADAQAEATASLSRTTYQRVTSTHDVTEAGQPDCWYLDTSGSKWMQTNAIDFNTWTQDTRRNLLTETESFGASAWIKNRQTVTENAAADDLGNTIADKLIETAASDTHFCGRNITVTIGQPYTFSVYAKAAERSFIAMGDGGGAARTATFNLTTGAVTNVGAAISNPTATDMGNGWWRCSVTYTPSATTFAAGIGTRTADGAFFETYLGDGTSGVLLTKAHFELGTLTTYQRVGTDEMTVIAGVRKLSDAASALVAELSASVSANNGAFWLAAPTTAAADFGFRSKGTAMADCDLANVYAAPRTDVLTGLGDISSDTCALRLNGTAFSVATDQGSGNFGNHILYIGSRAGTSAFFNGHLFHLIVRGKTTEGSKLTGAEKLTARKTGITI